MIKTTTLTLFTLLWGAGSIAQESDSLGTIGDGLDLYAVLDAFKNAETIEAFEKTINDPDQQINNLDLNEDDEVDYIQVHDEEENGAHAFILRIDMGAGEDETQDVAVIELEKTGDANATIQIVGDEELYGTDYIVEPKEEEAITKRLMIPNLIVLNVWGWPSVRFVFGPTYVRWRSPYRWGHYPVWWKPWRPVRWGVYHGLHARHHRYYHVVHVHRCGAAHGIYRAHRRTAVRIRHHRHYHAHHPKQNGHAHKGLGGQKQQGKRGGGRRR